MNKIGLIIKREYLRRVSKKSFLLLTPFLFAALVFVPLWLSTIKGDDAKQIAIIDATGKYAPLFKNTEEYAFVTEKNSSLEDYRKNPDKEILLIPPFCTLSANVLRYSFVFEGVRYLNVLYTFKNLSV